MSSFLHHTVDHIQLELQDVALDLDFVKDDRSKAALWCSVLRDPEF